MGNKEVEKIIGRHTYGDKNIVIRCEVPNLKIVIGSFCSIANGCKILLGADHRIDCVSSYPFGNVGKWIVKKRIHPISKGNVIIGNDVWIGNNVTIMSGKSIGDGAVIGSCAVVSKNIPPYAIAVGNPIVIKRYRFTEQQIEELLKIKWWDWPDKRIQMNINLMMNNDIDKFIKEHI